MAGEFVVKAAWNLGPRTLPEWELVYFPEGSSTRHQVGDNEYVLLEPCVVLTKEGDEHAYWFDKNRSTRHAFVHFTLNFSNHFPAVSPLKHLVSDVVPEHRLRLVPHLLRQIICILHRRPVYWEHRCQHLLLAALCEFAGNVQDDQPYTEQLLPLQIRQSLSYIEGHLREPISVKEMARAVGWSHEHLSRTFVRTVGTTPQLAIQGARVSLACRLLVQENLSIKEIAYATGFKDESYFSRVFARVKGISASEYRRKYSDPRILHHVSTEGLLTPYPLNEYFIFTSSTLLIDYQI